MTAKDADAADLTMRLNAYKTASPQERARLWEDLFPALKRLARNRISAAGLRGREGPTELVIAQYEGLDRALGRADATWENRARFFGYAALSMRRHLVAEARRSAAGELLDENLTADEWSPTLILALEQALVRVSEQFPRGTQAFMLRHYLGHSHDEIMDIMSDSYRKKSLLASDLTVVRKALMKELEGEEWWRTRSSRCRKGHRKGSMTWAPPRRQVAGGTGPSECGRTRRQGSRAVRSSSGRGARRDRPARL
jgi:DNA-directed RNA polymerase specialized sigma24 family protein